MTSALTVMALLGSSAALAGEKSNNTGGILAGYTTRNPYAYLNQYTGPTEDFDDGGRYFHWIFTNYGTSVKDDIETAILSGTLTVSVKHLYYLRAVKGAATFDAELSGYICEEGTPNDSCTCGATGAAVALLVSTTDTFDDTDDAASATLSADTVSANYTATMSQASTPTSFEVTEDTWICVAAEGTAEVDIYGTNGSTATAQTNFKTPRIHY